MREGPNLGLTSCFHDSHDRMFASDIAHKTRHSDIGID